MAAELVGTAYVRIRAITAGLASEIKDGVEKGAADADIDKAGEGLGTGLGEGASGTFKESMTEGVTDAFDSPEMHKASEEGGEGVAKDVAKGVEDENKRKNPFASMLDSLKGLSFGDAFRGKFQGIEDELDDEFRDLDIGRRLHDSMGDFDWDVPPIDLDVPGMERDARNAGVKIGDGVTDGIDDSHRRRNPFSSLSDALAAIKLPKPIAWAGIFGPTTLAPIIGTLLAGLALITQALGFIVTAAAGAGAALAGIAAVALPGFAALFAAFKTQTKQLEKFKKRAKELLKPWEQFGIATQQNLLPGVETFLERIQHLIPMFVQFGTRIGEIIGNFAEMAGETLTSEKNMRALGTILTESETFWENITDAANSFIDLLLPFFAAVAPLATEFSESLKDWMANLSDLVNTNVQIDKTGKVTGNLADKFKTWYDRFVLLVGVLGDVFTGLWDILEIAGETGTPFFDKIAEAAQKFSDWTSSTEGKNKIKKFFDDAKPVLDEIWRLLGNVYRLIVAPAVEGDGGSKMFSNLAWALDLLNDVLENPITKKVVPYLLSLVVGLSLLSVLSGPVKAMGEGLNILGGALKFIGGLGMGAANVILSVAGAILKLGIALVFNPVGALLFALAAAALAVYFAFKYWDEIVDVLQVAWEWFSKLSLPMKILVGTLAVFIVMTNPLLMFAAAVLAIVAAIKNWDAIVDVIMRVRDAIVGFFTETIPQLIEELPGHLADAGEAMLTFFKELPNKLRELLMTGLEEIPGLILDGLGGLWELGENILGVIAEGIQTAVPWLLEQLVQLPSRMITVLGEVLPGLINLGVDIIGFLVTGLVNAIPKILAFFITLPIDAMTALRRGIFEQGPRALEWFKDLPGNLASMLSTALDWLWDTGWAIIRGLINGLIANIPRLIDFFRKLPGRLLSILSNAGGWLVKIGASALQGLYDGMLEVWDSVNEFFGGLPRMIVDWFTKLPGMIVSALTDFVDTVIGFFVDLVNQLVGNSIIPDLIWDIVEWFAKLPLEIVTALFDLVTTVVGVFWDLGVQLLAALPEAFLTVFDWFTGLPKAIFDLFVLGIQTILNIGGRIARGILSGITGAAQNLWDWVSGLPKAVFDLFILGIQTILDVGGKIVSSILEGITTGAQALWDWVTALPGTIWNKLLEIISEVWDIGKNLIGEILIGIGNAEIAFFQWFLDLPGLIWDTLSEVVSEIWDIGKDLLLAILVGIGNAEIEFFQWFTDLPGLIWDTLNDVKDEILGIGGDILGWILEGLGGIGTAVKDGIVGALQSGWNAAIDLIPAISIHIDPLGRFGPAWDFDWDPADHLKWNAMGGIIPGSALGQVVGVGEAGAEAIIPLTRPGRALAIMQEAGLDKLVLNAYMGGTVATGKAVAGDTTMLRIDHAVMTAPVDADMIVQKVTSAYNRLAS